MVEKFKNKDEGSHLFAMAANPETVELSEDDPLSHFDDFIKQLETRNKNFSQALKTLQEQMHEAVDDSLYFRDAKEQINGLVFETLKYINHVYIFFEELLRFRLYSFNNLKKSLESSLTSATEDLEFHKNKFCAIESANDYYQQLSLSGEKGEKCLKLKNLFQDYTNTYRLIVAAKENIIKAQIKEWNALFGDAKNPRIFLKK